MIKQLYNKFCIAIICLLPSIANAGFTISPVKLKIHKDDKIAALTIRNDTAEPRSFQLTMFKAEFENGQEVYKQTKDLIVTPLSFRLAPGKTQLIRVAIKDNIPYSQQEESYRVSLKEMPHKINMEGSTVQLVTEFRVPVSITDIKPEPEVEG